MDRIAWSASSPTATSPFATSPRGTIPRAAVVVPTAEVVRPAVGAATGSLSFSVDKVNDVMDVMGKEQIRRIPVINERGALIGIVAQADIVREARDDKKAERTIEKISEAGGRHTN